MVKIEPPDISGDHWIGASITEECNHPKLVIWLLTIIRHHNHISHYVTFKEEGNVRIQINQNGTFEVKDEVWD